MSIRLGDLATRFDCELVGDPDVVIERVAALGNATPDSLSFLANSSFKRSLSATKAGAVIVRPDDADNAPTAVLLSDNPYATYARMAAELHPAPAHVPGVHSSASIDPSASVDATARIDAGAVIGEKVNIAAGVHIGSGCVIGPRCEIGADSQLVANVTLARDVTIGERTILQPGAVIGSDGFGNAMTPDGWIKVPQVGGVRIGSDVEIGANTTVDCGAVGDTVIEDGVRIDNLCMIAHNVHVGAHTAMAAMVGVAGSAKIGKRCMFAGKSATVGHISVCDDVTIWGRCTVSKDITEPGVYGSSFTHEPIRKWNRMVAQVRRLGRLFDRVAELEKRDS